MPSPLQILIVEDDPTDAELMVLELQRSEFDFEWQRVDTEVEFLAKLNPGLNLILSDYKMPNFTGLRALELLKQQPALDIPFIVVSGSIGEETAVDVLQHGAADYLLKDRIARLGQSVRQALFQKQLRGERRRAEGASQNQLQELQRWQEAMLDREERIIELKQEVNDLLGQLKQPNRYFNPAEP